MLAVFFFTALEKSLILKKNSPDGLDPRMLRLWDGAMTSTSNILTFGISDPHWFEEIMFYAMEKYAVK